MSDLIDRQAAIDALMAILDKPSHAEFLYTDEICGALNGLPSVQPEKTQLSGESTTKDSTFDTISRQDVNDALERVASFFPYRIPGKGETYDKYNEAWNDAIGRAEMEIESLSSAQPEQAVKDCRNCKHGKYNDYHDTYFCYNAEDCSNWDKWETSAQPVHIPLDTDDIFDAELAKRILNNK